MELQAALLCEAAPSVTGFCLCSVVESITGHHRRIRLGFA